MTMLDVIKHYNIPVVDIHPRFQSAKDLLDYTRPLRGVEGFVVDFEGHKVKVKADHYVTIHRTKDLIRYERNIAEIIVNEQLDDILPLLDAGDIEVVRAFEKRLNAAIENVLSRIEGLVELTWVLHGGVKKEVALKFIPNLKHKEDASFIFSALDGKQLRPLIIKKIKDCVGNGPKYETTMNWMEN